MKAWLNLRHAVPERHAAFTRGLERLGYSVAEGVTLKPAPRDILVTWNRIQAGGVAAATFESRGCAVLVTENASWGNDFAGERWYTLARGFHNVDGCFPHDGPKRFDRLGVELAPWRAGGETVILPQRGIGPVQVAMPLGWPESALRRHGGRLRPHPGTGRAIPLAVDLAACGRAVTWGSGAAVQALAFGVPVISEMPNWIGAQDNTDAGRLEMFRRLAWAQWTLEEIASGEPMARLLA